MVNKLAFLPVMLTFFTMGFVDLVGAASNHVQADLGLTESSEEHGARLVRRDAIIAFIASLRE